MFAILIVFGTSIIDVASDEMYNFQFSPTRPFNEASLCKHYFDDNAVRFIEELNGIELYDLLYYNFKCQSARNSEIAEIITLSIEDGSIRSNIFINFYTHYSDNGSVDSKMTLSCIFFHGGRSSMYNLYGSIEDDRFFLGLKSIMDRHTQNASNSYDPRFCDELIQNLDR